MEIGGNNHIIQQNYFRNHVKRNKNKKSYNQTIDCTISNHNDKNADNISIYCNLDTNTGIKTELKEKKKKIKMKKYTKTMIIMTEKEPVRNTFLSITDDIEIFVTVLLLKEKQKTIKEDITNKIKAKKTI